MKNNIKKANVGVLFVGILTGLIVSTILFPSVTNAKSSDFEIVNGVLKSYTGDGGDIIIPDSVTSIGDFVFEGNGTITSITIPESVTSIGLEAFWYCTNLTNIAIPSSVTYIGSHAFSLTPWLKARQKDNPLVVVNGILVDGHSCEGSVNIEKNVNSVCMQAFDFNNRITKVTLSNTVTSIGTEAFAGCRNLNTVIMKDSVTDLGENVFFECSSLTKVKLSNSLRTIPEGTFWKCTRLINILIPDSVLNIRTAFDSCKRLKRVTISSSVTSIDDAVFDYCNKPTIYGIKDSYTYKYAKNHDITFKALSISDKQITLSVGDVRTLELNSLAICTWISSDKLIATVNSNGKVTAIRQGNVVIKAYLYGKTFECKVTVK